MKKTENFFRTRNVLALLLPLLLLAAAGAWQFLRGRGAADGEAGGGPAQEPPGYSGEAAGGPGTLKPGEGIAAARIPEAYDPAAAIDIRGSEAFRGQVLAALKLIWTADRDTFMFVRRSLQAVRSENRTGFYAEDGRAVAALSGDHAFRSVTWCAGIIAHQAWHAAAAGAAGRKRSAAPPPPGESGDLKVEANPLRVDYKDIGDVLRAEDKAFEFQLKVLRAVGAPEKETGPVFRRAPRDFHLAHDGNYTLNP